MGANTAIEWAHHTFNPWRGCSKVAPGCANCYAEALSKRNPKLFGEWGPNGTRVVASEAAWKQPLKWNRAAACCCRKGPLDHEHEAGCPQRERPRVFCASVADVFEEWHSTIVDSKRRRLRDEILNTDFTLDDVRRRLFDLIDATPNLDWLLLTKRPENILENWPLTPGVPRHLIGADLDQVRTTQLAIRPNVWLGTSIATQADADRNLPLLLKCRDLARVLFVSAEPLLEEIDLTKLDNSGGERYDALRAEVITVGRNRFRTSDTSPIDWVIVGGESGPHARPCPLPAVRSLVQQCGAGGVPVFVKQLGSNVRMSVEDWTETPCERWVDGRVILRDKKGGDPAEWPEDLRVRQLPKVSPH